MARESPATYRITDLTEAERPRERLAKHGPQVLSNAELLAILLRVGIQGENSVQMGQRLLQDLGGLPGLHRATLVELAGQFGMGLAKAAQIKAAIELGMRIHSLNPEERPLIRGPEDAAALVQDEMAALPQEHLRVINLDTRNRVINIEKLYVGSLNQSTVRIAEIFRPAIQRNAASIIIVHNHPSGDPSPSPEDMALTRGIIQAGKLLEINVLDHLVIGLGSYVSLKERGVTFG